MRAEARSRPWAAAGLLLPLLPAAALVLFGLGQALAGRSEGFSHALLGGAAGAVATAVGAVPALWFHRLHAGVEDVMLGIAAGMMLAASAFSLLLPGIDAGALLTGSRAGGVGLVVLGMAFGVWLMLALDHLTPHTHEATGDIGPGHEGFRRAWLFVFAIALHNFPEGMAVGVGFGQDDLSVGVPVAAAIALQDLPEGLAVALALRGARPSPGWAVLVAASTGLLEPVGAVVGVSLAGALAAAYPLGLGLAAGAMLFVVSHEVIPETHRAGHPTRATLGLMAGFAVMMALDTALG